MIKVLDNNKIFYPQTIYLNINFDLIKKNIKNIYTKCEDFGSILAIYCDEYIISVNNIGKIEIFFDKELDYAIIMKEISSIEFIFKKYINDFKILN